MHSAANRSEPSNSPVPFFASTTPSERKVIAPATEVTVAAS